MRFKESNMQPVKRTKNSSATLAVAIIRGAMTLTVLSALLLVAAHPAQAQTEQVLYSFSGQPDGANPYGGVTFSNNDIYGTTYNGGLYGYGSVYQLTPNGSGGYTEALLYSFCPAAPSCTDGQNPALGSLVFDTKGNLYGTTFSGGANGDGEVFELTPGTGGTWTQSVIYSFTGEPDAANPVNGLLIDANGNLYGTAYSGGGGGNGAVFEVSPNGSGGFTEQVIYSYSSTLAGLVMNSTGDLFGTSSTTVFELAPNGSGGWGSKTIFTFTTVAQGTTPNGTLAIDSNGNLYGTTTAGGKNSDGVAYKLTLESNGTYKESILYSFGGTGSKPDAGIVLDSSLNIYGTTNAGGKNGAGVVYELVAPTGTGGYKERTLQTFIGENGAVPYDALVLNGGYLYGTTYNGGADGEGAVFVVNAAAKTTTTTCTSSMNPSTEGEAVTFTATVTPAPPNGEIVVFEPVGQSPMTNGVATYTTSNLKVGQTKITAVYNGDLNFINSRSVSFMQVVNK